MIILVENNSWDFDHAVEVLGMECAWASRNSGSMPHRFKRPPLQPPSLKRTPPMMTKFFIEDEARALFRPQEVEKLNNEMLQVAPAMSEKEIGGCNETAEAVPSPTTSAEWTKVTPGNLAGMLHQNIPGHMQPGPWGPSERLTRGCEVDEREKGDVMRPQAQSDAKGWAFDPLRYTDPWSKTMDGKGIKTHEIDAGHGGLFEQGYYGQPTQSPTG